MYFDPRESRMYVHGPHAAPFKTAVFAARFSCDFVYDTVQPRVGLLPAVVLHPNAPLVVLTRRVTPKPKPRPSQRPSSAGQDVIGIAYSEIRIWGVVPGWLRAPLSETVDPWRRLIFVPCRAV